MYIWIGHVFVKFNKTKENFPACVPNYGTCCNTITNTWSLTLLSDGLNIHSLSNYEKKYLTEEITDNTRDNRSWFMEFLTTYGFTAINTMLKNTKN